MMKSGSRTQDEAEIVVLEPPHWARCLMALVGIALLIGPTVAVLWPR